MISLKYAGALMLGALIIGLAVGRFAAPAKVITQTKIVHDRVDHSVITHTQEKLPDGSIISSISVHKDIEDKSQKDSEKIVEHAAPRLLLSGVAAVNFAGGLPVPMYGPQLQVRVVGPFYLGALALFSPSSVLTGANIGIQF